MKKQTITLALCMIGLLTFVGCNPKNHTKCDAYSDSLNKQEINNGSSN